MNNQIIKYILITLLILAVGIVLGIYVIPHDAIKSYSTSNEENIIPVTTDEREKDAKNDDEEIKKIMADMQIQAQKYYDATGSYMPAFAARTCPIDPSNSLFGSPRVQKDIIDAAFASGVGMQGSRCATDGNEYAVSIRLKSSPMVVWCVDSTGAATTTHHITWVGATCPTS